MKRLVHLANFNSTNIGNGALILGTERVLREDWNEELHFLPEPWDDYTFDLKRFDRDFVSLVNRTDGLIVGAAVALNARDYLRNAGMRLDLPYELWSTFSKPIIFYGISYRVWPFQKYYHLDQFKKAMDYILDSPAIMFSVRNDGTKDWLESLLGYSSDRIETVPDPALYVPTVDNRHPELVEGKTNVLISLNNEDAMYRFGGRLRENIWKVATPFFSEKKLIAAMKYIPGMEARKKKSLKHFVRAVEMLSRDRDLNIILCPHYFDDYRIMSEFIDLFPARLAHQKTVSSGLLGVPRAPYFYDLYAKVDLAISMRVHSMSPAIGLATPMVAVSTQDRMTDFMDGAGLQDFIVDFFDPDLAEKLYAKLKSILINRDEVRRKFQEVRAAMRAETLRFNRKVAAFVSQAS
jgi:hypothetical protein